jgi:molybdenum cofactor guanylyltransferase
MVTVAIQAGGQSSRMGQDKALVRLAGRPLIEHQLDRLRGLAGEILVTTNHPEAFAAFGVRTAADAEPGAGALAGLRTALQAARGETVLVVACDMPFLSRPLLEHLLSLAPQADAVVPRRGGEYEPLHAVYARTCLPAVEACLANQRRRVISFYDDIRVLTVTEQTLRTLDPHELSFFNINTPDDLKEAEQLLRQPPV